MTRDEKQASIIKEWENNNRIGLLIAVGSFGKTITAIKAMLSLHENFIKHIVVPQIILKEQWEEELNKWGVKNYEVFVINSYIKTNMTCDFLIIDEIHKTSSTEAVEFNKVILESSWKYFLGLTATLSSTHKDTLNKREIKEFCNISVREALTYNWVNKLEEYNVYVNFTKEEQIEYDNIEKMCTFYFKTFFNNFDGVKRSLNKTTIEGYLRERNKDIPEISNLYLTKSKAAHHASQFMIWVKKRKDLIFKAKNKYKKVLSLLEEYPNQRVIIFSENNEVSNNLHKLIPNSVLYHSGLTTKQKKINLELFKSKQANILIASKSADAGFNDESLTLGIIVSCTSSDIAHRQRCFRLTRYLEDKTAKIFNLIIKGSQEENWTKSKQKFSKNIKIIT